MPRSNALGFVFGGETVQLPGPARTVAMPEAPPPPARSMLNRERMLCCVLTGVLVASGLAVGVWYAVTEA